MARRDLGWKIADASLHNLQYGALCQDTTGKHDFRVMFSSSSYVFAIHIMKILENLQTNLFMPASDECDEVLGVGCAIVLPRHVRSRANAERYCRSIGATLTEVSSLVGLREFLNAKYFGNYANR